MRAVSTAPFLACCRNRIRALCHLMRFPGIAETRQHVHERNRLRPSELDRVKELDGALDGHRAGDSGTGKRGPGQAGFIGKMCDPFWK